MGIPELARSARLAWPLGLAGMFTLPKLTTAVRLLQLAGKLIGCRAEAEEALPGLMVSHGGGGRLKISDQGTDLSLDDLGDGLMATGRGGEEQRGDSWHRSRMQS